jgi:hypothetical protein
MRGLFDINIWSTDKVTNMIIVSYGMGTDSTALLGLLHQQGIRPDQITAADTGDERPHTYRYLEIVREWCLSHGFPDIDIVRWIDRTGRTRVLSEDCFEQKTLPSAAFGFKGCSTKYKIQPQERRDRDDPRCQEVWKRGDRVIKMIGYEYGEERRMRGPDNRYEYQYPLIDAQMDREACVQMITGYMGLPRAGKSSCWHCPQQKIGEWADLKRTSPDLFDKAIAMEANAELTSVKGLGRRFAIADLTQAQLAKTSPHEHDIDEMPCGCVD